MSEILKALKLVLYTFFVWLEIDLEVFSILMIFMMIDSVCGSVKSIRLGKEFKFKLLMWGISLKFLFLIIPLVVALLGKALGNDLSFGVDMVMKILVLSECYSIFGNIYSAKNKVEVKNIDIISMLLKSIRTGIRNVISKGLNAIEQGGDLNDKKD